MLAGDRILVTKLSGSNSFVESLGRGDMDFVIEPADSYPETSATEAAAWGNLKLEDIGSEAFLWIFGLGLPVDPPDFGFTDDVTLELKPCSVKGEEALSEGEGTEVKRPPAGAVWF